MEDRLKIGQEVIFEHGLPDEVWIIDRITKAGKCRIRNMNGDIEWADFDELKHVIQT